MQPHYLREASHLMTSKAAHTHFNLVFQLSGSNHCLPLSCLMHGSKLLSCSLPAKVASELPQCLFQATSCVKDQRKFCDITFGETHVYYVIAVTRGYMYVLVFAITEPLVLKDIHSRVHKHLFCRLLRLLFIWRATIRAQVATVSAIPSSVRVQSVILG